MAGKIIADIIEAPFDSIKMNVANVTVLTANNSGLTYLPTGNVNINIGSTASLTLGNVTVSNLITANGGIKFPATQVASGDANTLDDYEEGTWTPTYIGATTAGTTTYSSQFGYYTKIGRQVTVSIYLALSAATGTGGIRIGGLPFSSGSSFEGVGSVMVQDYNWSSGSYLISYIAPSSSTIRIYSISDNAGWGEQSITNEAQDWYVSMTYFV